MVQCGVLEMCLIGLSSGWLGCFVKGMSQRVLNACVRVGEVLVCTLREYEFKRVCILPLWTVFHGFTVCIFKSIYSHFVSAVWVSACLCRMQFCVPKLFLCVYSYVCFCECFCLCVCVCVRVCVHSEEMEISAVVFLGHRDNGVSLHGLKPSESLQLRTNSSLSPLSRDPEQPIQKEGHIFK